MLKGAIDRENIFIAKGRKVSLRRDARSVVAEVEINLITMIHMNHLLSRADTYPPSITRVTRETKRIKRNITSILLVSRVTGVIKR